MFHRFWVQRQPLVPRLIKYTSARREPRQKVGRLCMNSQPSPAQPASHSRGLRGEGGTKLTKIDKRDNGPQRAHTDGPPGSVSHVRPQIVSQSCTCPLSRKHILFPSLGHQTRQRKKGGNLPNAVMSSHVVQSLANGRHRRLSSFSTVPCLSLCSRLAIFVVAGWVSQSLGEPANVPIHSFFSATSRKKPVTYHISHLKTLIANFIPGVRPSPPFASTAENGCEYLFSVLMIFHSIM